MGYGIRNSVSRKLGLVPKPVVHPGSAVVVTLEVPGRPMDAMLAAAVAAPAAREAAAAFCIDVVAPMVRRFHDLGLCHRDLYWNHLFANGFDVQLRTPLCRRTRAGLVRSMMPWLPRMRSGVRSSACSMRWPRSRG